MLSDILPTGFECGVLNGQVKPGDTVAIVGAGPIGLAALLTAQFYSPAEIIDDRPRRQPPRSGASDSAPTRPINSADGKAVEKVMALDRRARASTSPSRPSASRPPSTSARSIVAPGGTHRQRRRPRQAGAAAPREALGPQHHAHHAAGGHRPTPMLLKMVQPGSSIRPGSVTHRFALADIMKAYDTFGHAAGRRAQGNPAPRHG